MYINSFLKIIEASSSLIKLSIYEWITSLLMNKEKYYLIIMNPTALLLWNLINFLTNLKRAYKYGYLPVMSEINAI
jgi:hypothetical protein